MKRFHFSPKFWFWPVAALAVLSLHFWFPETSTGTTHDSYSPTAQGQKAFYRLVTEHPANFAVARNRRPLASFLNSFPTDEVLCILMSGPPRRRNGRRSSTGSNRGFAAVCGSGGKSRWTSCGIISNTSRSRSRMMVLQPENAVASIATAGVVDRRQARRFAGCDAGGIRRNPASRRRPIRPRESRRRRHAAAVFQSVVDVRRQQRAGDTAARIGRSAGTRHIRRIAQQFRHGEVVGILFDPLLRPVTIQILLVTILFGWWHNRRFGPLTPNAVSPRQNIVEHTDMVGNLYWKSQDGYAVLKAYLRQLTQMLRLKTFKGNEDRVLELIARRSGRPVSSLRKDLQLAFELVRSKHVERRTAAKLIRRLSLIEGMPQYEGCGSNDGSGLADRLR